MPPRAITDREAEKRDKWPGTCKASNRSETADHDLVEILASRNLRDGQGDSAVKVGDFRSLNRCMSRSLNMQRVADLAGVSKSSVSLALRDDPRLALATRRRVQEVAARLGYRKNPIVASLMSQLRANSQACRFHANLALINCSKSRGFLSDPAFAEYGRGIRERADREGYGVEDFWIEEPGQTLARVREILQTRNIKGLVLAVPFVESHRLTGRREFFEDMAVAAVGFDRMTPVLPRAGTNWFETAREAAERLVARDYRRPAVVVGSERDRLLQHRISLGFTAGLQESAVAGRALPEPFLVNGSGRSAFKSWFEKQKPDAIATDVPEVRDWVASLGLQVPDDVGLLHLDWSPALTGWAGMSRNAYAVGVAAAELVMDQLGKNEFGVRAHPKLVLIESDFVPGPSVREVRGHAAMSTAAGTP